MAELSVLQVFVGRCNVCPREVHFKAEGPPYFPEWAYFGDHGDSIEGWQIPTDKSKFRQVRCPDHVVSP